MKNFKNNIFTILIALLIQTVIFAQELPNDFGYSSNNTDPNATDAPIDSNLWILLLLGFLYVYSKYKRVRLK